MATTTSDLLINSTLPDLAVTFPGATETTKFLSTDSPENIQDSSSGMSAINGIRIFVCAFGVLGNVFVVMMILLFAEFKKGVTYWYILQLAIADTAFLLTLPFKVVEDVHDEWIYSDGMCKAKEAVLFINYYSSIAFLTVMALDRYIAICHAFSESLQKLRTYRAAFIITAVIWIGAILLTTPVMMYSTKRGKQPNCKCDSMSGLCKVIAHVGDAWLFFSMDWFTWLWIVTFTAIESMQLQFPEIDEPMNASEICIKEGAVPGTRQHDMCKMFIGDMNQEPVKACSDPKSGGFGFGGGPSIDIVNPSGEDVLYPGCHYEGYDPGFKGFVYFNFIVMFIVPFCIIATCYALIVHRLTKTRFRSDSNTRSNSTTQDDRDRNRVVTMCATLVVVFVVCWLPHHSVHMAKMNGIRGQTTDFCSMLFSASTLIAYMNSAINPYLYFIGSRFKSQLIRVRNSKAASTILTMFTRTRADSAPISGTSSNSQTDKKKNAISINENSKMVQEASTGV